MKLVSMVCPNCGASLQVDTDQKNLKCSYCGNSLYLDDEVQHIQYDNAEETGYKFEKGRQRAQDERNAENSNSSTMSVSPEPKKRKTWLWVLGWVCIFPLPLTILMLRNQKLKMSVKIAIIAVAWIVYFAIGIGGSSNNEDKATTNIEVAEQTASKEETAVSETDSTDEQEVDSYQDLNDFIDAFNAISDVQITSQEEIDIHDKSAGYYRTEFRLQAYDGALAYHLVFSDGSTADLIDTASWQNGNTVNGTVDRIYVLASSKDSFDILFRNCWKVMHGDKVNDVQIDEELENIMHPYNEDNMEYLYNSGSGVIENVSFTYDIKEKNGYFEFFID